MGSLAMGKNGYKEAPARDGRLIARFRVVSFVAAIESFWRRDAFFSDYQARIDSMVEVLELFLKGMRKNCKKNKGIDSPQRHGVH
jgi:hypothetical protein